MRLASRQSGVGLPASRTPPRPSALWQVAQFLAVKILRPLAGSPAGAARTVSRAAGGGTESGGTTRAGWAVDSGAAAVESGAATVESGSAHARSPAPRAVMTSSAAIHRPAFMRLALPTGRVPDRHAARNDASRDPIGSGSG